MFWNKKNQKKNTPSKYRRRRLVGEQLEQRAMLTANLLYSLDFDGNLNDDLDDYGLTIDVSKPSDGVVDPSTVPTFAVVKGPQNTDPSDKVLRFRATATPNKKARAQLSANKESLQKASVPYNPGVLQKDIAVSGNVVQTEWMFIQNSLSNLEDLQQAFTFLTIAEIWNGTPWGDGQANATRVKLSIVKPEGVGEDFIFASSVQDKKVGGGGWEPAHLTSASSGVTPVAVPMSQWFQLQYYYKEGLEGPRSNGTDKPGTGRFQVNIRLSESDPWQNVIDLKGRTMSAGSGYEGGLSALHPVKMYTSGGLATLVDDIAGPLTIYWDDVELYDRGSDLVPVAPGGSSSSSSSGGLIGGQQVIQAENADLAVYSGSYTTSGGYVHFDPSVKNATLSVSFTASQGTYSIKMDTLRGQDQGNYFVFVNGVNVKWYGGYAETTTPATVTIGTDIELNDGENTITFLYKGTSGVNDGFTLDSLTFEPLT